MTRYAADTSVPADRSRSEIERTLARYGATAFQADNRRVRFRLTMPDPADPEFTRTPTGRARSSSQAQEAWEQACRSSWRSLALVVKAKLEAIAAGISSFDDEFLAWVMLPDGSTVSEHVAPAVDAAYRSGVLTGPLLALGPGS